MTTTQININTLSNTSLCESYGFNERGWKMIIDQLRRARFRNYLSNVLNTNANCHLSTKQMRNAYADIITQAIDFEVTFNPKVFSPKAFADWFKANGLNKQHREHYKIVFNHPWYHDVSQPRELTIEDLFVVSASITRTIDPKAELANKKLNLPIWVYPVKRGEYLARVQYFNSKRRHYQFYVEAADSIKDAHFKAMAYYIEKLKDVKHYYSGEQTLAYIDSVIFALTLHLKQHVVLDLR